jgi:hydroxymethylpyrimidine/phosphomethylpyrimidine kinase
VPITAWKVGFLGSAEAVSAVAEVLSDYPDCPVTYLPSVPGRGRAADSYLDALRELVLPQTAVLVGNHKTLTDFLLPDWDSERPSARELAVAAARPAPACAGDRHPAAQPVWTTCWPRPGPITGEKFERFETAFVGAGDTLSAALAALLSVGAELHAAVSEALLPGPGAGRGLPPRHGPRHSRPLLLGPAPADEEGGEPPDSSPTRTRAAAQTPRRMH